MHFKEVLTNTIMELWNTEEKTTVCICPLIPKSVLEIIFLGEIYSIQKYSDAGLLFPLPAIVCLLARTTRTDRLFSGFGHMVLKNKTEAYN